MTLGSSGSGEQVLCLARCCLRVSFLWPLKGPLDTEMMSKDLKAQRAVVWSRRFSLLYAMGVWTVIGYFVSRSVRFREIPLEEKKKDEQSPPPSPLDHNEYSRSV